jgi:Cu/Ag efflux protein CusF
MKYALLCAFLLALTGCVSQPVAESRTEPKSLKEEPLRRYELKGVVQRIDPQSNFATIKHDAIGDWMGPMTMDFPVKDPADLAKLKEGSPVDATLFVQGFTYWVGEVKESK